MTPMTRPKVNLSWGGSGREHSEGPLSTKGYKGCQDPMLEGTRKASSAPRGGTSWCMGSFM